MQRLLPSGAPASDEEIASWYAFGPGLTVRSNMIMSADGAAVGLDGLAKGLSGPADGRLLGLLRGLADAVLVGAGTLRKEQYNPIRARASLAGLRAAAGMAPHPVLVMVTREPQIDASYRALAEAPVRPIILCARDTGALSDVAEVIVAPTAAGLVDLRRGVALLAERGMTRLHTEGGPHLLGRIVAQDLLDEYCLAIAPRTLGGEQTLRPVMGDIVPTGFALAHIALADDFLFMRYVKAVT